MVSLLQLLERLADHEIDFVVIGRMAAVVHGANYATQGAQICAVLSQENIDKFRAALRDLKPVHRMHPGKLSFLDVPAPGTQLKNIYIRTEIGVLDILGEVVGVGDFNAIKDAAEVMDIEGRKVRVLSLPDLITCKETLARGKDLSVAIELRVIAAKRGLHIEKPPRDGAA